MRAAGLLLLAALAGAPLADYTETVPGSDVSFEMIAVGNGRSAFWIGSTEVSWDEYELFYFGEPLEPLSESGRRAADAVSRPTPPYGAPDRGWGTGRRPAIGMTHHAARQYCRWLSAVTGKAYRLPSDEEWQAACREEETAWLAANSRRRTHPVASLPANALGIFDLLGNVAEFTSSPMADGSFVVKGGSYLSASASCASRRPTRELECRATDPQEPKSLWWYSDCFDTGFRVARSAP